MYLGGQIQAYPLTWSVQDPPFKQGLLEHSSISMRQINQIRTTKKSLEKTENYTGMHLQFTSLLNQTNLLVWHCAPAYPGWQLQAYPLTWSVQHPPFKQGLLEHSSTSMRQKKSNKNSKKSERRKTTLAWLVQFTSVAESNQLTCLTLSPRISRLAATNISINLVSTTSSI